MSSATYVGHAFNRRVKLGEDESVVRSANAVRFGPIGMSSYGTLTLTSERLIWTPMPYPWDFFAWTAVKNQVGDVSVHRNSIFWFPFERWALQIRAASRVRRFRFGGILPEERSSIDGWLEAIRQWQNQ